MKPQWASTHPWVIRFTHWLNAVVLIVMIGSGLEIFAAFPTFGEKIPQRDLMHVPQSMRLGGWLGGALEWHVAFAWLFTGGGIAYATYQLLSGHWRQTLFMRSDAPGVWPMAKHYLRLGPAPAFVGEYNPLQKLAYTSTVACGAVAILTGLALYKPVQLQTLTALAGGFGAVRLLHFLTMCGFLAFIPGHLLMVALHGWNNCRSMLTGWKETG
jgi:Ni/Fe-hydrogenase b-type cytochrome subunit